MRNMSSVIGAFANVMGKANLTDAAWQSPTDSAHRFFKVKVAIELRGGDGDVATGQA